MGEYVMVRIDKGFTNPDANIAKAKAEAFANTLAQTTTEKITTADGTFDFVCQRGVFEVDLEE